MEPEMKRSVHNTDAHYLTNALMIQPDALNGVKIWEMTDTRPPNC